MGMRNRWIGGLALAAALTLGACAPPEQGAAETSDPSPPAETAAPTDGPEASEMVEATPPAESMASETPQPTPIDYEY